MAGKNMVNWPIRFQWMPLISIHLLVLLPLLYCICLQIGKKGKFWKRYIQSKDPAVLSSYKKIRNIVRNKTRQTDRFNQKMK